MKILLLAFASLMVPSLAQAHSSINLLDLHLGGQRQRVEKRLRKQGCKKLHHRRHGWHTDWQHRRTKRPRGRRARTAVYWCTDPDWPEAGLRELHFDRNRLHRVVIHFDLHRKPRDPVTGAPFVPSYKELQGLLKARLGEPDERREEMPKAFGTDHLRALEQRRGGFWSAWYGRLKGRVDVGLRLSGNPNRPGELIFYLDARDRRIGKRILKRRERRLQPRRGQ